MGSWILRTASRCLIPLLWIFSIMTLLRGHNLPGGGFIGGLMAAGAFSLYVFAYGVMSARYVLWFEPRTLIASGLLLAFGSGTLSFFYNEPFLTGQWSIIDVPLLGELYLGTPLLFDIGVYLVVIGASFIIISALSET